MKYNKIEMLLKSKGCTMTDYANYLGVVRQQINNKKKNDSFKADELIKLAEMMGYKLAFVNKDVNTIVEFDVNDLSGEQHD